MVGAGLVPLGSRWKPSHCTRLVSGSEQREFSEKTCPRLVLFWPRWFAERPWMQRIEFITLNERLCSRPHSITHEPDDKLHRLLWLSDPKGCLINQRLDMATISRRNGGGQGCPGRILPHLIICWLFAISANSPWSQVWAHGVKGGGGQD